MEVAQQHGNTGSPSTAKDSPQVLPGMKLAGSQYVVSVLVEIVSCSGLAGHELCQGVPVADAYVKVKLASPTSNGSNSKNAMMDIHKTKPVPATNSPNFSTSNSSFVLDGLPVEDLQRANGLLFKVKHAGDKTELGGLVLSPTIILQASGISQTLTLKQPKGIVSPPGIITITCRPAESTDIDYHKHWKYGYFKDYNSGTDGDTAATANDSHFNDNKNKSGGWKLSLFGSSRSNKKATKAGAVASPTNSAIPTQTTVTSPPPIETVRSTDDTVDTHEVETPTADSSGKVQELSGGELLGDEQVQYKTTEKEEHETQDNTTSTTTDIANDGSAIDPYKAGEMEDKLEKDHPLHGKSKLLCGDDCFTGNCVIS